MKQCKIIEQKNGTYQIKMGITDEEMASLTIIAKQESKSAEAVVTEIFEEVFKNLENEVSKFLMDYYRKNEIKQTALMHSTTK